MKNTKKKRIWIVSLILVLLIAVFVVTNVFSKQKGDSDEPLTYDQVITYVKNGDITKIKAESNKVTVTMKDGTEKMATTPSLDEFSSFISEKIENGSEIEFEIVEDSSILSEPILTLISTVVNLAFLIIIMKKMFGILTDKVSDIDQVTSDTRFNDVAGIDEEKEQLREIVEFLKNPTKYTDMGAKIPRGILLNGDPGTGKTLLAKAIAGEAGVPFYQTSGSYFEEKFVGVGASRIRKLFQKAKENAPCIIFIDEIDSVAQSRYDSSKASNSEQSLNQLLAEMDGFDSKDNVIVIAATNHIEVLDSAILRPGRFDRQIFVPKPDVNAREKILQVHARNKKLVEDISLKEIAKKTIGFSGADLENVMNEAAIYAVNQEKQYISKSDIDEAIVRVLVGLEKKNAVITEEERRLVANHEAGHAIVSAVLRPEIRIFGISIIPRGKAGGYNMFDEPDTRYQRKSDMYKSLQVNYGGRAAEEIVFGDISNGASNDFEKASKIAHLMVTEFAMNGELLVKIGGEVDYNEQLDTIRMAEAEKICKEAYSATLEVIKSHKNQLVALADLLYEKEYLSQEEIANFIKENL